MLARRAGNHTATIETTVRSSGITMNTAGSRASTPNKKLAINRVNPNAAIKNTSLLGVPDSAKITFTVTHYYGDPGPYTRSVTGPLAKGQTKLVPLSHPGALDAYGCTAKATWTVLD